MKKITGTSEVVKLMGAMLCLGMLLAMPVRSLAGLAELPDMAYKTNSTMSENLKSLVGKKVNVTLASGNTFSGTVKVVGKGFLHLEKLEGKEYFDALIRLEEISAIDARFRDYQR